MSQTVIAFQEDCILVATGKPGKYPAVTETERIELQGQGDSFARWKQALEWASGRIRSNPVRLVLPADFCVTRIFKIPDSKGKQLAEMAVREVRENFRNEVADYSIAERGKQGVDICAGGAEQANLDQFVKICRETGLTVSGITVPVECYLKFTRYLRHYQDRTAVYLFFETGSMTNILSQDGQYLYSSRSRLFSEPGTWDFGTEIVRSISGILQFYAGRQNNQPITDVYYAGCPAVDFEVSVEGIRELNLEVFPMEVDEKITVPGKDGVSDWIPCIGAMSCNTRKEKQIDLYAAGQKDSGEIGIQAQGILRHLAAPAALLAAGLITAGVIAGMNWIVMRDNLKKQDWIESVQREGIYQQALELEDELKQVEDGISSVERLNRNLSVYPEFSGSVLRLIEVVGGGAIDLLLTDYETETGVLMFDANSKAVIDVSDYIRRLQDTGLFHTVDYTGYTYEDGVYTLSLSCTLEGKTEDQGGAQ